MRSPTIVALLALVATGSGQRASGHQPGGGEHSEAIVPHLRLSFDSNSPPINLEGSTWRILADGAPPPGSPQTEDIGFWAEDWDYQEPYGWSLDFGADDEWWIAGSGTPAASPMMCAPSGGLPPSTSYPHTLNGQIIRAGHVIPYVVLPFPATRAPGFATLTLRVSNYNDNGEYDPEWIPGSEPGEGHWAPNPRHADQPVTLTMTISFVALTSPQYVAKGQDLVVTPRPETWPDVYQWEIEGLDEPVPPGTTTTVSGSWYEHIMDSQVPPLRGTTATVRAEGNVAGSLAGGQNPAIDYRVSDTTHMTIFSVNIEPFGLSSAVEQGPDEAWLWYIGLPLYMRAQIYPPHLQSLYGNDVNWITGGLHPVPGTYPPGAHRRKTFWNAQPGDVSVILTLGEDADMDTQSVAVADWFYSQHGNGEPGINGFGSVIVPIGAYASQITEGEGWRTSMVVTAPTSFDSTVSLPTSPRANSAWLGLDYSNFSSATTQLYNSLWQSGVPVFNVDDAELTPLLGLLFDWRGHHPPGGIMPSRQQSALYPGAFKSSDVNCFGSVVHAHGAGLLVNPGYTDAQSIVDALNVAYGRPPAAPNAWRSHRVQFQQLASWQFDPGDIVVWPGQHAQIVLAAGTGTSTTVFAANNYKYEYPVEGGPTVVVAGWTPQTLLGYCTMFGHSSTDHVDLIIPSEEGPE